MPAVGRAAPGARNGALDPRRAQHHGLPALAAGQHQRGTVDARRVGAGGVRQHQLRSDAHLRHVPQVGVRRSSGVEAAAVDETAAFLVPGQGRIAARHPGGSLAPLAAAARVERQGVAGQVAIAVDAAGPEQHRVVQQVGGVRARRQIRGQLGFAPLSRGEAPQARRAVGPRLHELHGGAGNAIRQQHALLEIPRKHPHAADSVARARRGVDAERLELYPAARQLAGSVGVQDDEQFRQRRRRFLVRGQRHNVRPGGRCRQEAGELRAAREHVHGDRSPIVRRRQHDGEGLSGGQLEQVVQRRHALAVGHQRKAARLRHHADGRGV